MGKGEPVAEAEAGCGFFGLARTGLGGGPIGLSSAMTGLGSTVVEAAVVKSPGLLMTCTGTLAGWNLFMVKVTDKPVVSAGTAIEQGVLQVCPVEVRASAPDGTDSSATCTVGGADLKESSENEEQPARPIPATAITNTRRMTRHSNCGELPQSPEPTLGVSEMRRNGA